MYTPLLIHCNPIASIKHYFRWGASFSFLLWCDYIFCIEVLSLGKCKYFRMFAYFSPPSLLCFMLLNILSASVSEGGTQPEV